MMMIAAAKPAVKPQNRLCVTPLTSTARKRGGKHHTFDGQVQQARFASYAGSKSAKDQGCRNANDSHQESNDDVNSHLATSLFRAREALKINFSL